MGSRILQGFLAAAGGLLASQAMAQGGGAGGSSSVHLNAGALTGTYTQSSANSGLQQSDSLPGVKVQGAAVDAGLAVAGVDADLSYKSVTAKSSDWYKSRRDMGFNLGPRFDAVPWLIPSVGVYEFSQQSDRSVADAPIAFIDKTTTFSLGLRFEGSPVALGNLGIILYGKAYYLTSGEAKANFGNIMEGGIGYGFNSSGFSAGLTAGVSRTYLDASRAQDDVTRDVRSVLQATVISFFVGF